VLRAWSRCFLFFVLLRSVPGSWFVILASCRQGNGAHAPAAVAPVAVAVVEDRAFFSVDELFMAIICVVLFLRFLHVAVSVCKTSDHPIDATASRCRCAYTSQCDCPCYVVGADVFVFIRSVPGG
jgi:hypothetical protein